MWDVKRKSCNHLWSYTLNAECLVCARDSLEARVADLEKQRAAAQALVEQLTEEECCACEDAIAVMRDVDLDLETPAEGLRYLIKRSAQPAPAGLSEWLISRIDAARSEDAATAFADVLEHVTRKAAPARPAAGSAPLPDAAKLASLIEDCRRCITLAREQGSLFLDVSWADLQALADAAAAALARPQPAQEPAAWLLRHKDGQSELFFDRQEVEDRLEVAHPGATAHALYRAPPPAAQDARLLRAALAFIEDIEHSGAAKVIANHIRGRLQGAQEPQS